MEDPSALIPKKLSRLTSANLAHLLPLVYLERGRVVGLVAAGLVELVVGARRLRGAGGSSSLVSDSLDEDGSVSESEPESVVDRPSSTGESSRADLGV